MDSSREFPVLRVVQYFSRTPSSSLSCQLHLFRHSYILCTNSIADLAREQLFTRLRCDGNEASNSKRIKSGSLYFVKLLTQEHTRNSVLQK
jgi:hypothetical protein